MRQTFARPSRVISSTASGSERTTPPFERSYTKRADESEEVIKLDEKYTDDVQKLDMGRKAFLTYDDINQELPEGLVSPDDIEDIFHAERRGDNDQRFGREVSGDRRGRGHG